MDFIFLSVILHFLVLRVVASYDIACQWSVNLMVRALTYAASLHPPTFMKFVYLVPKFHLPVHVKTCWSKYSYNFCKWVGRTDGEGVERLWSWLNRIANSTSQMSAGSRWDTLDDFCNFNNWRKVKGLGTFTLPSTYIPILTILTENELTRKLVKAIPMAIIHWRAWKSFSAGLRDQSGVDLDSWEESIVAWEQNTDSVTSPYILPDNGMY